MAGEAWPADSDSTLREPREGDGKGVKCSMIRKRRVSFPVFRVHLVGPGASFGVKCLLLTFISYVTDGHCAGCMCTNMRQHGKIRVYVFVCKTLRHISTEA